MKFFTFDLIDRYGSEDDAIADAADAEWEEQVDAYDQHLKHIEPSLTDSLLIYNGLLLHDALVESINRHGNRLVMVLQKDIPPRDLVTVTYLLTNEPIIRTDALSPPHRTEYMGFMYDELDVIEENGQKVFTQSILFSNGWEVQLRFRDVEVVIAEPIYPVPRPTAEVVMQQSA